MSIEREKQQLTLTGRELKDLVDRLDRESGARAKSSRRASDRFQYRAGVIPYVTCRPCGSQHQSVIYPRNISAGGLACLHRGFIHTGSELHLVLKKHKGDPVIVRGIVRSCRHISKLLHETGIEFIDTIDPAEFCQPEILEAVLAASRIESPLPSLCGRLLVVTPDKTLQQRLMSELSLTGAKLTCVGYIGAAIDALKTVEYHAVVIDDDLPEIDGEKIIPTIRAHAPRAALLSLTWSGPDAPTPPSQADDSVIHVQRPADPRIIAEYLSEILPPHGATKNNGPDTEDGVNARAA